MSKDFLQEWREGIILAVNMLDNGKAHSWSICPGRVAMIKCDICNTCGELFVVWWQGPGKYFAQNVIWKRNPRALGKNTWILNIGNGDYPHKTLSTCKENIMKRALE